METHSSSGAPASEIRPRTGPDAPRTHVLDRDPGTGGVAQNTARKPPSRRPRPRGYAKTGVHALRRLAQAEGDWLAGLGAVGDVLRLWRAGLIADLGGADHLSTQQRAIVELATRTYLLLESVDRWMLAQPSLINKRNRVLFPIVAQRTTLADSLARSMTMLGLERRARPSPTLADRLAQQADG
jgi:hypothetical protein